MTTPLIGSDTEVFIIGLEGKPVSSIGLIGGSKDNPRLTEHGAVQEDNVLAEVNINPSATAEEFVKNRTLVFNDLLAILPDGYSLSFHASQEFEIVHLSHPLAMIAGCDPDYDAWDIKLNDKPEIAETNIRTAGGHIHVSWDVGGIYDRLNMIRAMDMYVGLPSLILDKDQRRRQFYGKAGAHRPKDYGVEFRTVSNFWAATEELTEWVFHNTMRALEQKDKFSEKDKWSFIQDIINNNDVEQAIKFINKEGIVMP